MVRTFTDYLIELRSRLLYCLIAIGCVWAILLPFSNKLYHLLAIPLIKQLPSHSNLIATNVTAAFFVPLQFATLLAIVITIPYLLYQLWVFIAPALYQSERRWIAPLLLSSTLLFYLGMCFAYFLVFPLLFHFFVQTTPTDVALMPDISTYLDLSLQFLLTFGLAFEVPVAIVILVKTGITDVKSIVEKRRYFIVAAFVIGMLIAPPDVASQTMLAVPLWMLYEVGLLVARFIESSIEQGEEHAR